MQFDWTKIFSQTSGLENRGWNEPTKARLVGQNPTSQLGGLGFDPTLTYKKKIKKIINIIYF